MKKFVLPAAGLLVIVTGASYYLTTGDSAAPNAATRPPVAALSFSDSMAPKEEPHLGPATLPDTPPEELDPAVARSLPLTPAHYGLLKSLKSGNADEKEKAFSEVLPALIQQDPASTAKLVATLPPWAWREDALLRVAREWSSRDAAAAAEWANTLPPAERTNTLRDVCIQLAQLEPEQAVAMVAKYQLAAEAPLVETLVHLWAVKDLAAAQAWTASQADAASRDKLFARVALAQAAVSPADAAQLVADRIAPGPVQTEAAISVLHQWALNDPASAKAWVTQFPQGDFRKRAEGELAGIETYRPKGQ